MANIFEISTYEPNQQLILKSKKTTDTLVYYVAAAMLFLGISFTVVTASFYPIVILGVTAFISLVALRYQLIHQITFTPTTLIVEYAVGFIKWKRNYNKIELLDWFINIYEVKIKIGYKEKIILQIQLENLEPLPVLTENVAELMKMEIDMNEKVGLWENIRFRSKNALPIQTRNNFLFVKQEKSKLTVVTKEYKQFDIDIQKQTLVYTKWFSYKKVDLNTIEAIYYYYRNGGTVVFGYKPKDTYETTTFFKFQQYDESYQENHYIQLNLKIDVRNIVRALENLSIMDHIKIKEQKF